MANYTVTIQVDDEFGRVLVTGTTLVYPGDTVTFQVSGSTAITMSGFASNFWTDTSSYTGTGSVTKTVASGVAEGVTDYITFAASGYTTGSTTMEINSVPDYVPDSFVIADLTDLNPKGQFQTSAITVDGFNRTLYVYVDSGGGEELIDVIKDAPDTFKVSGDIPTDYGLTSTIYVYIKDAYDGTTTYSTSFDVSTKLYPDVDEELNFPITSGNVSLLADVGTFFGTDGLPAVLTNYLKGAGKVPTIAGNEAIPTTPPISLTDFYGSKTGFYFIYPPPAKHSSAYIVNQTGTASVSWYIDNEIIIGYGELAKDVEYKYEWTYTMSGSADNVTITANVADPTAWSTDNTYIKFLSNGAANLEGLLHGTLTIYARNAVDTSLEISRTVAFSLFFFGV